MALDQALCDLIAEKVGRFNVDILSGWEAGMKGQQRIGGKLFKRNPPEHLTNQRYCDWCEGRDAAARHKALVVRKTYFDGQGLKGAIRIRRAGWVGRAKVLTQMEDEGVRGDVVVTYVENGEIKRTVMCGI